MEECLKLVLCGRDRVLCILFLLILLPVEADLILKERRGKRNLISVVSFNVDKVVLILLTEFVVFHERFAVV